MQKQNLLFGLIGIVIGVAVGYFVTQSINNNTVTNTAAASSSSPQTPPGMPAEVLAMIKKANDEPNNFEAQVQVAALYQQIGRQEKAVEFLQRAAKLKPNDESVLLSLTDVLLGKGDKAEAQKTFAQLEKLKPATPELKQQREALRQKLK